MLFPIETRKRSGEAERGSKNRVAHVCQKWGPPCPCSEGKARTDGSISPIGKTRFREDLEAVHKRGASTSLVPSVAIIKAKS